MSEKKEAPVLPGEVWRSEEGDMAVVCVGADEYKAKFIDKDGKWVGSAIYDSMVLTLWAL